MSKETPSKVKVVPKLVKLEKGLKLAESWVNNMSLSAMDELSEVEFNSRPSRLGLGAKVSLKSKEGASADPLEKRLRAKLNGKNRVAVKNKEESDPSESQVDDDSDNDPESRTNAFIKKRAPSLALPPPKKNKHK